ncbi:complement factor H-related protein 1-like [Hippoglossus stenolepis]|uniref:complement factor H-related protein 1-like n=1 Tax=Hippoglossus stenolepis TaxID=195615 RepID=UPI001FAEE9B8|nr:complement factor H-related protein 1-like [Hippoglossus stenolepis]
MRNNEKFVNKSLKQVCGARGGRDDGADLKSPDVVRVGAVRHETPVRADLMPDLTLDSSLLFVVHRLCSGLWVYTPAPPSSSPGEPRVVVAVQVQGNEDKMNVITRSCVLFFWMHTLTFVKSQEHNWSGGQLRWRDTNKRELQYWLQWFFQLLCIEGKWQSRGTKCQPQQCPVIHVSNNVQVIGDPEEANVGNVVRFSCKSNSEILSGSQEIYCNEKGEWSGEAPTCKAPLACEQPPPLANGDTKNSMKFSYRQNERVEYICQNYYIMQGGPFKTCNNGEWTGEIICLRPCTVDEEAMRGRNIRFRYGRKDKLYAAHGDVIEFSCTRGRPVGSLGMRPMCVDGVVHLPSCQ